MEKFGLNNSEIVDGDFEILEGLNDQESKLFESKKKTLSKLTHKELRKFDDRLNIIFSRKGATLISLSVLTSFLSISGVKSLQENMDDESGENKLEEYIKSFENNPEYKELKYKLIEEVGEGNINQIESFSIINNDFYSNEEKRDNLVINSQIVGEDFDNYFKEIFNSENPYMPENMLNDVKRIVFFEQGDKMPPSYGSKLQDGNIGGEAHTHHIQIYKNGMKDNDYNSYLSATSTTIHELIHSNDWIRDAEMSSLERLEMLDEVVDRLKSEDRFRSSYVESIENPDKKEELYIKATEYLAEIGKAYFMDPDMLKKGFTKDFNIIDKLIKIHDSEFDVFESNSKIMAELEKRITPDEQTYAYNDYSYDEASYDAETLVVDRERMKEIESINIFGFISAGEKVDIKSSKSY